MTVIEVKENGAIRTKMLSCDSPFAENDANCRFSYYDGTTYWIVTNEFKKYLQEMGREAHVAVRQY